MLTKAILLIVNQLLLIGTLIALVVYVRKTSNIAESSKISTDALKKTTAASLKSVELSNQVLAEMKETRSLLTAPFVVAYFEFVIIDTPARPHSNDLKELAKGCDLLILPTSPDVVSLEPMLETARDLGDAKYCALITIVPPHPNREGETMRSDLKAGGIPVFKTMIRRTVGFAKAALAGRPIRDIDDFRTRTAWQDYNALGDEIRKMLK